MIIDSDLIEQINKYKATIKENIALSDNGTMYLELNNLAGIASGLIPLPIDNERLMSTILGYALIGYHDIRQEILRERQTTKS